MSGCLGRASRGGHQAEAGPAPNDSRRPGVGVEAGVRLFGSQTPDPQHSARFQSLLSLQRDGGAARGFWEPRREEQGDPLIAPGTGTDRQVSRAAARAEWSEPHAPLPAWSLCGHRPFLGARWGGSWVQWVCAWSAEGM